ncbi:MAG: OAM dimerization domain-containing protein [bacterium]
MLKVNPKKIKAYGDRLDDGVIQLSFTLPVSASPEAKEAARRYAEGLGLTKVAVATMEAMGEGFSYFVAYGVASHTIDFARIHVPKVEIPQMDYSALKDYMARNLEKPIVVIGAATGADAHTVGIDAIMNMKGFGGDYGLERYPHFKAINLRSQMTNQQLIDKAVELKADAILISQVVTQRDSHIKNLKEFHELAKKDKQLHKEMITIIGGPRLDHAQALKLGFDAGFGPGTKPSQVACFIVHEYMKRHHIKEKQAEALLKVGHKVGHEVRHAPAHHAEKPAAHHAGRHHAAKPAAQPANAALASHAPGHVDPDAETVPASELHKKRRRRGRRGGRRHRKNRDKATAGTNTPGSEG